MRVRRRGVRDFSLDLLVVNESRTLVVWNSSKLREEERQLSAGDFLIIHSSLGFVGVLTSSEWEAMKDDFEEIE